MATTAPIRDAITTANERFMSAFGRGDAAGLADLYTEQGQLFPTHSDVVEGKHGIQSFWQGAMDMGIKGATLETIEAEDRGDTAHEVGRYTLGGEGGQVLDRGKYVVIWKHEDGQWKLHRDIWNSSMPASQQ